MRCGWGFYFRGAFEAQAGNSPLQGQSKPPAKLVVLIRSPIRKAGDGNRTHVSSLEGWCSTIELHPHEVPSSGIEPETRGFSVLCSTN